MAEDTASCPFLLVFNFGDGNIKNKLSDNNKQGMMYALFQTARCV